MILSDADLSKECRRDLLYGEGARATDRLVVPEQACCPELALLVVDELTRVTTVALARHHW